MPVRQIPDTDLVYYLVCFDEEGRERREADGSLLSETLTGLIGDARERITDVFLASHGWKGDVPAAIEQYDRWVGEMGRSPDREAARTARSGFKGIVAGLHWPSLPFGDETIAAEAEGGLLSGESGADIEQQVEQYAASLGDGPDTRKAIRTILTAAQSDDGQTETLPEEVRLAYERLFADALPGEIEIGTLAAPPGADHRAWNADEVYREARREATTDAEAAETGLLGGGGLWDSVKGLIRRRAVWFEAVWQGSDGALFLWYLQEPAGVCRGSSRIAPKIGAALSFDGGTTDRGDPVDCNAKNGFFGGRHGDMSVILDSDQKYL